ncbi:MAG: TonB-dependent receptor, partial [Acetobacter aceti]
MNGASANVKGIDLNGRYKIIKNLTGTFGVELLDSRFTSYPQADITSPEPCGATISGVCGGTYYGQGSAKGRHLPYSSSVTASLSLTYVQPSLVGDFRFTGSYRYNSGFYGEPDNRLHQKPYSLFNAQLGWTSPSNRYNIAVWANNLTNSAYSLSLFSQSNGDVIMYAPPRTYGFTAGVNF